MANKLKQLAKAVYELTKADTWLGGKSQTAPWPKSLGKDDKPWHPGATWTLSPEVTLQGFRVRVCVSWNGSMTESHNVRVFIDDELKHPGGCYSGWNGNWFGGWSWKIAAQTRRDGGKTGPTVGVREYDILIEAHRKLQEGPNSISAPVYCDLCHEALVQYEATHSETHQYCPSCRS